MYPKIQAEDEEDRKCIELQAEYIYLKSKEWLDKNKRKSYVNWGYLK